MRINSLVDKKILILGLGVEGLSTFRYLRKEFPNKILVLADQKSLNQLDKVTANLIKGDKKVKTFLGKKYQNDLNNFDFVFKSPGLKIKKTTSAKVISQTEVFIDLYRDRTIGITGTKGKTTTSSLIFKILKDAGYRTHLIGNVGNPAFDYLDKAGKTGYFVYELSSYQLENLEISPHVAVFLNIYKEHLDYHGGFEKYKKAKANIVKWQKTNDLIIYNSDSSAVKSIVKKSQAKKIPFSLSKKTDVRIRDKWIIFGQDKVLKATETKLKGKFNLNNILAAVAVAKALGVPNQTIAQSVKMFEPIKHRLEYIGEFRGIKFYDDSIATIPEAAIAALDTLSPNVNTLIAGGYDRGVDYSNLAKKISEKKILNLILFPQTGKTIIKHIKTIAAYKPNYFFVRNMRDAVKVAKKITQKGKICLLSPASSSFNLFIDYKDRGDQFTKEVKSL